MVAVPCLFFQGLKWSMGMPLYSAFLGCSRSMELWLIPSVWPASRSAPYANTYACWKGSYSFMFSKKPLPHTREYASAAENSNNTLPCALFALLILSYFIIYGEWGGVCFSALLESMGRPCDPLPAVNRCYLTTSASMVRSLDWNATLSSFIYWNVLGFSL